LRKCLLMLMAVFSTSLFASAVHAQTVQIFLGYQYLRPSITVTESTTCPPEPSCPGAVIETVHPTLKGWDASGTFNPFKILGVTGDFSGNYGSIAGSTLHVQTYLVGPQVHFPGRISPFGHLLLGKAHETIGNNGLAFRLSESAFAMAAGGGLDLKLTPYLSVRAVQFDYLMTKFQFVTDRENQFRVSAGLVFHF
jgi:hypothetical protein